MKLKNIKDGDVVETKVDLEFKRFYRDNITAHAGTICKVVKIDTDSKSRYNVYIESNGLRKWINNDDIRKPHVLENDKVSGGSDLTRYMLNNGDKLIACLVAYTNDAGAINTKYKIYKLIASYSVTSGKFITVSGDRWNYAVPVNMATGEPLSASDVDLYYS